MKRIQGETCEEVDVVRGDWGSCSSKEVVASESGDSERGSSTTTEDKALKVIGVRSSGRPGSKDQCRMRRGDNKE